MSIKTVDAKTLKSWLESNQAVLVDVREPAEHASGKISSAKLVPISKISKNSLPEFVGKKLVVHCNKGGRGGKACEKLLSEDASLEIYNLEGGMNAWKEAGFSVKASGKFFLPLDRQVQLTIGLVILLASIVGYFTTPLFFVLTGFLGAGLTFAGLTGFCGLAIIMAKMPWNQKAG